MFSRKLSRAVVFALVLVCSVSIGACDFNDVRNPIDEFKLVLELPSINTTVAGAFFDAQTKSLINEDFKIKFAGKDAAAVVDLFSDPVSELKVTGGLISFGIKNDAVPTNGSPVEFEVLVQAAGYQATSQKLFLKQVGDHDFRIYLINNNRPPAGAATSQASTSTGAGGGTTQGRTVQTPTEAQGQGQTTATVAAGTVAQTASGQPLTGQVTTQVSYYNPQSQAVSQAIPGGGTQSIQQGGQTTRGALASAVLTKVQMFDASGNQAISASPTVATKIGIPLGRINPATGAEYKAGDRINVYTFNGTTGAWVFSQEVTLVAAEGAAKASSKVQALVQVGTTDRSNKTGDASSHLPLDALINLGSPLQTCGAGAAGATLTFNRGGYTGPLNGKVTIGSFTVSFVVPDGVNSLSVASLPDLNMASVPNVNATVSVGIPGQAFSAPVSGSPCSGNYTVNVPTPTGTPISVNFTVVPQCTSGQAVRVKPPSGSTLTYWKQGTSEDSGVTFTIQPSNWTFANNALTQGQITIGGLETGATYNFKGFFPPNTVATTQQTITGPTKTVTMDAGGACSD